MVGTVLGAGHTEWNFDKSLQGFLIQRKVLQAALGFFQARRYLSRYSNASLSQVGRRLSIRR